MSNPTASQADQSTDVLTALVIDDEAMVRQLVHRTLEPDICRVAEAGCGEEGLRIIQDGVPPIDLVLTDLKMPGLDGRDVVEVLARYRPDVPVAVMSGYQGTTSTWAQDLGMRFLSKPFTPGALTGLVSSLVADARAMRARAGAQCARAEQAQAANALIRQQNAALRAKLDLVKAAWNLHRQLRSGTE